MFNIVGADSRLKANGLINSPRHLPSLPPSFPPFSSLRTVTPRGHKPSSQNLTNCHKSADDKVKPSRLWSSPFAPLLYGREDARHRHRHRHSHRHRHCPAWNNGDLWEPEHHRLGFQLFGKVGLRTEVLLAPVGDAFHTAIWNTTHTHIHTQTNTQRPQKNHSTCLLNEKKKSKNHQFNF